MMSMRLEMTQKMSIDCKTCGKTRDEHNPHCPTFLIEQLLEKEERWACEMPTASNSRCDGTVRVTIHDFLQCGKCRTQFSRGLANAPNLSKTLLHRVNPQEEFDEAYVLAGKGVRGKKIFRSEGILLRLRVQVQVWKTPRHRAKVLATTGG